MRAIKKYLRYSNDKKNNYTTSDYKTIKKSGKIKIYNDINLMIEQFDGYYEIIFER